MGGGWGRGRGRNVKRYLLNVIGEERGKTQDCKTQDEEGLIDD
jgi:hypothetical protein